MKGGSSAVKGAAIGAIFMAIMLSLGPPNARAQDRPGQPNYPTLVSEVAALQTEVAELKDEVAALKASSVAGLADYVTIDQDGDLMVSASSSTMPTSRSKAARATR